MIPLGWAPRPPSWRAEGVSQVFAHVDCEVGQGAPEASEDTERQRSPGAALDRAGMGDRTMGEAPARGGLSAAFGRATAGRWFPSEQLMLPLCEGES